MAQLRSYLTLASQRGPGVLWMYGQLGSSALRRLGTLLFVTSRQTETSVCRAGFEDFFFPSRP